MRVPVFHGLSPLDLMRPLRAPIAVSVRRSVTGSYFYRARNAIYYLFLALRRASPALDGARARLQQRQRSPGDARCGRDRFEYCPVGPRHADGSRRCRAALRRYRPDVLYVIHYAGWPQPIAALVELCRRRGDAARRRLRALAAQRSRRTPAWLVRRLVGLLPLQDAAAAQRRTARPEHATTRVARKRLPLRSAGAPSRSAARAELFVQRMRGRGSAASAPRCWCSSEARAGPPARSTSDAPMSATSASTSTRSTSRCRRVSHAAARSARLRRHPAAAHGQLSVACRAARRRDQPPVFPDPEPGVCPLFFPILVPDKHAAADALRRAASTRSSSGTTAVEPDGSEMSAERALPSRARRSSFPIHQDLTATSHRLTWPTCLSRLDLRMSDAQPPNPCRVNASIRRVRRARA